MAKRLRRLRLKIEAPAAAELAKSLVVTLENPLETNSSRLSSLGQALAAVPAKIDAPAAAELAKRGAQRLAAALEDP